MTTSTLLGPVRFLVSAVGSTIVLPSYMYRQLQRKQYKQKHAQMHRYIRQKAYWKINIIIKIVTRVVLNLLIEANIMRDRHLHRIVNCNEVCKFSTNQGIAEENEMHKKSSRSVRLVRNISRHQPYKNTSRVWAPGGHEKKEPPAINLHAD